MAEVLYAGSWLITGKPDEAPLRDGAVVLDERGQVLAVGPAQALRQQFAAAALSEQRAILLPGLVNAHVHLELSALRGETRSGGGFGPWLTSMMEKRAALKPEQNLDAIEVGVGELLRAGTVAVGEVTNSLASVEALGSAPLLGRVFHEVYGMERGAAQAMCEAARRARAHIPAFPANLSYALAPHTLYSLHPEFVQTIVREAAPAGTSLHLAEHAAERAFLRDGSGPFADYLRARAVAPADWPPPGLSPVGYAHALGVLGPELIAVHLTDTDAVDLARIAETHTKAVLCPRSNLFIELKLPPLFDILSAGLQPGLGSDSLASNTSLDVLAEAAALHDRFPQLPARQFLSMATWYGAQALGLAHRVGALAVGLTPGLLAVDITDTEADPYRILLRSPPPPRRVLARPAMQAVDRPLGALP